MAAKLRKFLLRYYPPGIILQYERDGVMMQKPIDLLDLTPEVDIEVTQQTHAIARWALRTLRMGTDSAHQ